MAKLRLTSGMKDTLRANAEEHIKPIGLQEAYDAAYAQAKKVVTVAVNKKFTVAEMTILRKFSCAMTTHSARILYPTGAVQQFDYRAAEKIEDLPLVPNSGDYSYGKSGIYPVDVHGMEVIEKWVKALDAFTSEYKKRRQAYHALIQGATYLEDLLDVWPEAAAIIPKTGGAILALGPDQIDTIKRDLAERRKREGK